MEALEVAKYIINTAIERGEPISNFKLQKILYFTQREYYAETGKWVFDCDSITDRFEAWKFGVVVPSVYYNFNLWGANPIWIEEATDFQPDEQLKKIIDKLLVKYTKTPPWELVNISQGKAWNKHKNTRGKITSADIKDDDRYL